MSVALIAHYLGPKLGVGQYFDRLLPPLVSELKNHQIPVKIIASPNSAQNTPALREMKVNILPTLDYSPNRRYAWLAMNFASYCREEQVTLAVWLSNPMVLPWHPPTIAVIHDVNEWKTKTKYGSSWKTALRSLIYLDASLHFAKRVIVVSQGTQRDLLHFRPQEQLKRKLRTISNGTDSQLINLPPIPIASPTAPFLLSVGRIDPDAKCLPEAVALVSQLRDSGTPWEIHLVGGTNASTKQRGEEFLQDIEHLPWVHYHGYIDDRALAEWYRQATAVVFLSENEGFGLPIAEAAAFGRWVITSRNNQTSAEAGGRAIIAVDIHDPKSAATQVLNTLASELPPNSNLPKWDSVAKAYADEISATLLSSK
jgi:glycosyltransferase involved in cell wall biosynthesis